MRSTTNVVLLGLLSTIDNYADLDRFRAIARRSRRLGLQGSACVHPHQVPILNEEFSPTKEEVAQAHRVIAAFEEALAAGKGAIEVDGKMVDLPVVRGARALLENLMWMCYNDSSEKCSGWSFTNCHPVVRHCLTNPPEDGSVVS